MDNLLDLARPLEILYCWQALVIAATAAGMTRAIKTAIDATKGTEWRKKKQWIGMVLLPTLAVFFGALIAVTIPLHPEILDNYIEHKIPAENWGQRYAAFALWGGACGQFSSYIYDRIVGLLRSIPAVENVIGKVTEVLKPKTPSKAPEPETELSDDDEPGEPLER